MAGSGWGRLGSVHCVHIQIHVEGQEPRQEQVSFSWVKVDMGIVESWSKTWTAKKNGYYLVMGKLRILCVHGYRQNDITFREKSGAFRKLLKKHIDFHFVCAPHLIPEEANILRSPPEQERGWWFSKPDKSYRALDETDVCIGYEDSLQLIAHEFESNGPFDGVLGFSQGAAFTSLLCALKKDPQYKLHFKFAILIAGFKSLLQAHRRLYDDPIDCPTFHTVGETDAVIPPQSSQDLQTAFISPTVYRHNGGHYMPASPQLRTELTEFISPYLR